MQAQTEGICLQTQLDLGARLYDPQPCACPVILFLMGSRVRGDQKTGNSGEKGSLHFFLPLCWALVDRQPRPSQSSQSSEDKDV